MQPETSEELDELLSRPTPRLTDSVSGIRGDLIVLGAAGKMGPTLARMARRVLPVDQNVYAVSRFRDSATARNLEIHGVQTISCDLLHRDAVEQLPSAANVVYMAGTKFGTSSRPDLTWMMNAVVPSIVAERYAGARIVVFSTGCVYPLVSVRSSGCVESDRLTPPGEYANSCVARERVFSHYALEHQSPTLLFRLNYAIDLRYGVLHDIGCRVLQRIPVDVSMGYVNVIWQGDANARALQCLELAESPAVALNVTGREKISVRRIAERFADLFDVPVVFEGQEQETAWLSDASRSFDLLGDVTVSLDQMVQATAHWLRSGGTSLGKPTHFESSTGEF